MFQFRGVCGSQPIDRECECHGAASHKQHNPSHSCNHCKRAIAASHKQNKRTIFFCDFSIAQQLLLLLLLIVESKS